MSPFKTLILMTTYRCNLRCWYCHVEKKAEDLPEETALSAARIFLDQADGRSRIRFFGGETILRWPLIRAICEDMRPRTIDRDLHLDYDVTTNGILLTGEMIDFIRSMHSMELILSLDPEKEKESGRRLPDRVEELLPEILTLPWLTVNLAASPSDVHRMADHCEWLVEKGFKRFNFLPAYYVNWPWDKVRELEDQFDRLLGVFRGRPELQCKNLRVDASLPLFMDALVLDTDGSFYPNNLVLADARFQKARQTLRLGSVTEGIGRNPTREEIEPVWKSCIERKVMEDTAAVDWLLAQFAKEMGTLFEERARPAVSAGEAGAEEIATDVPPSPEAEGIVDVGGACNNGCVFCATPAPDKAGPQPTSWLKSSVESVRTRSDALLFTGGEPTVRADLPDLIDHARGLGFRAVGIRTNARRCSYPDYAAQLAGAGLTDSEVGIHGHTAPLHDAMTRVPGSFSETVRGARNLAEHEVKLSVFTVLTKSNYRHLEEIVRLAVKLGATAAHFTAPPIPDGKEEHAPSFSVRLALAAPYLSRALLLAKRLGLRASFHSVPACLFDGRISPASRRHVANCFNGAPRAKNLAVCSPCAVEKSCAGPWASYTKAYGWSELRPVTRPQPPIHVSTPVTPA